MWVCNVCRKKQDILTQSGEFCSINHSPYGVPHPPTHGPPGAKGPLSNGATERSVELSVTHRAPPPQWLTHSTYFIFDYIILALLIYGGGGGDSPVLMVHVTASAPTSHRSSKVRLLISLNVWFIVNYRLSVSPNPYHVLL